MEDAKTVMARKMAAPQKAGTILDKICPLMSAAGQQVACTSQCKLYKHNSHGYECPLQELNAISFQLKTIAGQTKR